LLGFAINFSVVKLGGNQIVRMYFLGIIGFVMIK